MCCGKTLAKNDARRSTLTWSQYSVIRHQSFYSCFNIFLYINIHSDANFPVLHEGYDVQFLFKLFKRDVDSTM